MGLRPKPCQEPEVLGFPSFHLSLCDKWMGDKFQIAAKRSGKSRELSFLVGFGAKPQNVNGLSFFFTFLLLISYMLFLTIIEIAPKIKGWNKN